jgi:cytochrome c553
LGVLAFVLPVTLWSSVLFRGSQNEQPEVRIPSEVAWTDATIAAASSGDALRGLIVARRCASCHGEEGFSENPSFPNLAGMNALASWKQLQDFRSGKRKSPLMQTIVADRTPRDFADLAAYYALLLTTPDPLSKGPFPGARPSAAEIETASRLVTLGDGTRGIPPCQACHGPAAYVLGAPSLGTQNGNYILSQLTAFVQGTRANDINLRMRTIASLMTASEREAVAKYYGAEMGVLPAATRAK